MEGPSTLRGTPPSRGPCRIGAPLSGERLCVGTYFAGEAKRPGVTGIRAIEPLRGFTVVTIGELRSAHDDFEPNAVPHSGRALMRDGLPHPGTPSTPASPQRHAWGYGRTAADVIDPLWWTTSVGVDAIVILHQSLGPSIANPSPLDRTETPQSKMLQVRRRRGTSASGGSASGGLKKRPVCQ